MLHEKIKHLREWRNYTQEYMAYAMGISQNVYSKIETGHQKISIERLKLIAIELGVTLEILICEDPLLNNIYNGEERRGEEQAKIPIIYKR